MRDTTKKIILILSVCALLTVSGVSVFAKQSMGRDIVNRVKDRVESGINEILPRTTDTTGGVQGTTPDTTNATTPESTDITTTSPIQSSADTTTKAPEVTSTENTTDAVEDMEEKGFNWWGVVIAVVIAAAVVILIIALLPKK